ncbi:MAG TPA: alanine dehydrogenase, partial [Nitrospiria bacterium]|nr:alanine dehydrogenase [Nitrospiria bacterium]
KGQILFTYLHLASDPGLAAALLKTGITGIAYETVQLQSGALPLLLPMSEIAGRLSVQAGAFYLQKPNGGKGILLSGLAGAARGHVVILGGGNVGSNAARIAIGLGARVTVLDSRAEPLRRLENEFSGKIETLFAYPDALRESVQKADLLIGAALVPGAKAPFLVSRKMIAAMEKGSVAVDVSVDQGGCFETTRPTTHENPVYELEGVVHYAVTNMPGAVPKTSTLALTNATLPYMMAIADVGVASAAKADPSLLKGINFSRGKVNHPAVAEALAMPCESFV